MLLIATLLGPVSSAQFTSQPQSDVRFEVFSGLRTPETEQEFAKIRAWLWQRWETHHAGSLVMITHTLEGGRAETHFEIKQNDSGAWHIVAVTERELTDLRYPGHVFRESSETDSYSLVRIPRGHNCSKPKVIRDSALLGAEEYYLVFRSKDGKILFDL